SPAISRPAVDGAGLCSAKNPSPFRPRSEQTGNRDEAHSAPAGVAPFYPRPKDAVSLARVSWSNEFVVMPPGKNLLSIQRL
ncbi:MAG: hypothetical protein VCE91_19825, partial [Nitrospinota bacterium]